MDVRTLALPFNRAAFIGLSARLLTRGGIDGW